MRIALDGEDISLRLVGSGVSAGLDERVKTFSTSANRPAVVSSLKCGGEGAMHVRSRDKELQTRLAGAGSTTNHLNCPTLIKRAANKEDRRRIEGPIEVALQRR
jgi:hypothetical protein